VLLSLAPFFGVHRIPEMLYVFVTFTFVPLLRNAAVKFASPAGSVRPVAKRCVSSVTKDFASVPFGTVTFEN
jgi:hypothetical protein